jgi:hypothetical protein
MIAQTTVTVSTPRDALSMSNLLNIRKIMTFGKTQMVIECVKLGDSANPTRYMLRDRLCDENKKIANPIIKGSNSPEIIPVTTLSYFMKVFTF